MTDFVTKKTNGIPECSITDEFFLSLKDADLHRTIQYKNNSQSDIPISINLKEFQFPYHCEGYKVFKDNEQVDNTKIIEKREFNVKIKIEHKEIILPGNGGILVLKISCKWRNFFSYLSDLYFTFDYSDEASYQLILRNYSLKNILHFITINGQLGSPESDYFIQENNVNFKEKKIIPRQQSFKLTLFSLATLPDNAILNTIKDKNKKIFSKYAIILVQHLLSDVVHLVNAFYSSGVGREGIFIVGIPYSTKSTTVKYLKRQGFENIWDPVDYPFLDYLRQAIEHSIKYARENAKKIIIVEDGGYIVPLIHDKFSESIDLFVGAVEQTTNGINLDKKIIENSQREILIPIISVAESKIKSDIEGPLIGRAVTKNIELIYEKTYRGIAGVNVGLIGYGTVGRAIAKSLKGREAIVNIFDKDPLVREEIKKHGFQSYLSIKRVIKKCKIIIESTGKFWTEKRFEMREIIFSFTNESYFVSASSKKMGINHDEFQNLIHVDEKINFPGIGVKYKLRNPNSSSITLIADGYPVNFFLGESVPDKEIAFIIAWLYKCAEILALNPGKIPSGIYNTNKKDSFGFYQAQKDIRELLKLKIN